MKKLNLFSNLWGSIVGSQCSDIGFDCRLTVGSPSGRYCSAISKFVAVFAILLTVGVWNVWADAIPLTDLNFGTPAVSIDFENLSGSESNSDTNNAVTYTNNLSGFGTFTYGYLGKNGNGVQSMAVLAGDNSPMTSKYLSMTTTANGTSISFTRSFQSKGAFSFKIAKTSKATIGLYNGAASGSFSHGSSAVWLQFDGGSNIKWSMGTNSGTPSGWQTVTSSLPSTTILDITVIYNNTTTATTYGDGIALAAKTLHVYVNGNAIMDGSVPKACSLYGNSISHFRIFNNSASTVKVDDIKIYDALPTAAVSCSNTVTLSKGSESNGTLTLGSTSITTCNATASTRQVTISVSPSTGYAAPTGDDPLTFTKSSGTVTATYKSGPTGSGPYTYVYEFDKDDSGTGTFGVTCSARTYTITLDNQSATTAGTESVSVTYNSSSNLTSAITKPTKTGYTFGGYYTMASGAGTQIIDADGNFNTNPGSSGTYTDASKNWKYTGDLELYAKWTAINYTITWKVDGSSWTPYTTNGTGQDGSSSAAYGTRVSKLPTAPTKSDGCGDDFVGWSTKNAGSEMKTTSYYNDLFETTGTSPVITQDTTFYAVFAEYDD